MKLQATIVLATVVAITAVTAGCSSEIGEPTTEPEAPASTNEALTTVGTGDSDSTTTTTTVAKPKMTVSECVANYMLVYRWSEAHATAYCECRITEGRSDEACSNSISFIDYGR